MYVYFSFSSFQRLMKEREIGRERNVSNESDHLHTYLPISPPCIPMLRPVLPLIPPPISSHLASQLATYPNTYIRMQVPKTPNQTKPLHLTSPRTCGTSHDITSNTQRSQSQSESKSKSSSSPSKSSSSNSARAYKHQSGQLGQIRRS